VPNEDPFFKVSDGMPENPKILAAGGDAGWLWVCSIAYARRSHSDGIVPSGIVPRLSDRKQPGKLAAVLVRERLWHEPGHDCANCAQPPKDSYIIHDYLEHQRSAEEMRETARAKGQGGSYGNHRRWHTGRNHYDPDCPHCVAWFESASSDERSHMRSDNRSDGETDCESHANRSGIAEIEKEKDKPPLTPPEGGSRRGRRQAYDYDGDLDFRRFWEVFPVKSGKPAAYKSWLAALARGADPEAIIKAAERYRNDPGRNPKMTKYPQGWLSDERYNDGGGTQDKGGYSTSPWDN
jgi:hypothetical protein